MDSFDQYIKDRMDEIYETLFQLENGLDPIIVDRYLMYLIQGIYYDGMGSKLFDDLKDIVPDVFLKYPTLTYC